MTGITPLGALAIADPAAARGRILAALEATEGRRGPTARRLAVSLRTLQRLLVRLGIQAPGPPRIHTGLTAEAAEAAVAEHGSCAAAARALGCHTTTVWRRARQCGPRDADRSAGGQRE